MVDTPKITLRRCKFKPLKGPFFCCIFLKANVFNFKFNLCTYNNLKAPGERAWSAKDYPRPLGATTGSTDQNDLIFQTLILITLLYDFCLMVKLVYC